MTLSDIPGYTHTKTSEHYCAAVMLKPDGTTIKGNCKKTVLMDVETAQAALSGGRVAYVALSTYEQLKQQGNG